MPAEPLVEQTLAEHIASLRQRKYEVPVIRDPDDVTDEASASAEKKREEIRPIIRRPSSRNPEFYEVLIKPGHYLFHEGDPADHLYVVLSGSIEIRLDGSDTVIATLGQGESFGEQAILYKGLRGASAFAREQVLCLEITAASLTRAIEAQPLFVQKTLRAMMLQLNQRNEMRRLIREKAEFPVELSFPPETPAGSLFERITKDLTMKTVHIDSTAALKAMVERQDALIVSSGQLTLKHRKGEFLCGEGMIVGLCEAISGEHCFEQFEVTKTLNGWLINGPKLLQYFAGMNSGLFGICRGIICRTLDIEQAPNFKRDVALD
jgi:CRP-like cAMP-binding protein